jgi:hypothetical protein
MWSIFKYRFAVLLVGAASMFITTAVLSAQGSTANHVPDAEPRPNPVMEKHDHECWTGDEKPLADIPGHVIVRWVDDGKIKYMGPNATGKALDELYNDIQWDAADAIAFCR